MQLADLFLRFLFRSQRYCGNKCKHSHIFFCCVGMYESGEDGLWSWLATSDPRKCTNCWELGKDWHSGRTFGSYRGFGCFLLSDLIRSEHESYTFCLSRDLVSCIFVMSREYRASVSLLRCLAEHCAWDTPFMSCRVHLATVVRVDSPAQATHKLKYFVNDPVRLVQQSHEQNK